MMKKCLIPTKNSAPLATESQKQCPSAFLRKGGGQKHIHMHKKKKKKEKRNIIMSKKKIYIYIFFFETSDRQYLSHHLMLDNKYTI